MHHAHEFEGHTPIRKRFELRGKTSILESVTPHEKGRVSSLSPPNRNDRVVPDGYRSDRIVVRPDLYFGKL